MQVTTHNENVKLSIQREFLRALQGKGQKLPYDLNDKTKMIHPRYIHFTLVVDEQQASVLLDHRGHAAEVKRYYYPTVMIEAPMHPTRFKVHQQFKDNDLEIHRDVAAMGFRMLVKAKHYPQVPVMFAKRKGPIYPFFGDNPTEFPLICVVCGLQLAASNTVNCLRCNGINTINVKRDIK